MCVTYSDMMTPQVKRYDRSLRDRQADATREMILDGLRSLILENPDAPVSFDALAARSGVNRRTIFRHFPTKEALLEAFWANVNGELGPRFWPESEADLTALPPDLFAALDSIGPIVRAAHASGAAREMRLQANDERQAAFRTALADVQANLPPDRARQLEAAVQLLFSATAWMTMKDTWNLDGRQAGEAAAWAIDALIRAAREEAGASLEKGEKRK